MIKVILMLADSFVLVISLKLIYFPTVELLSDTIDGMCAVIQSVLCTVHLLHFYVALNVMIEHLKKVKKNLERGQLTTVFDDFCKVLETYEKLGKIYQFFMSFLLLKVFYDSMSGIKKLQDYVFDHYGVETQGDSVEGVIVFWWLYLLPPLMVVLHEGHLFHEKVQIVNCLCVKLHNMHHFFSFILAI